MRPILRSFYRGTKRPVLADFLRRFDRTHELSIADRSEERVLHNLDGILEKQLAIDLMDPKYARIVQAVRDRLRR